MGLIITLIFIGILLFAIELLITPGVGVAGIAGIMSLIAAVVLGFSITPLVGTATLLVVALLLAISLWLFLRSKTWDRISLKGSIDAKSDATPQQKGIEIGNEGVTLSRLGPAGTAKFKSATTEVWSQSGIIDNGEEIEVVDIVDSKIIVRKK